MPRFLSTLLVVALLGGTAAAFAVTQGLKTRPSPITAPRIQKVFSPECDCPTRVAVIRQVAQAGPRAAPDRRRRRKRRPDAGARQAAAPRDGHLHLERPRRPGPFRRGGRLQAARPSDRPAPDDRPAERDAGRHDSAGRHRRWVAPREISPDGDGRRDSVVVRYSLSERAHALLFVGPRRVVFTRSQLPAGTVEWNGKIDGSRSRPGSYVLRLGAQDPAGNNSTPKRAGVVRVRYVELARHVIQAKAGTRFGVRVSADRRVHWRLGIRRGTAAPGLLVLRAPARPGRYTLGVTVPGYADGADLIVGRR